MNGHPVTTIAAGKSCHYCKRPVDFCHPHLMPTREHRQPLSRGGAKDGVNVVVACYLCNHTKGNMTEAEFFGWLRLGRPQLKWYRRSIGLSDSPVEAWVLA